MLLEKERTSESLRAEKAVRRSIQDLLELHPFLGVLALSLELVEDYSCDTAWTNGVAYGYNPKFVLGLTRRQRMGLTAHEVLHVLLEHTWRRKWRDPEIWNDAADYVINLILEEHGFEIPECGLIDPRYKGMPAEIVYRELLKRIKDQLKRPQPQSAPPQQGDEKDEGSSDQSKSGIGEEDSSDGDSGDGEQDDAGNESPHGKSSRKRKTGKGNGNGEPAADGSGEESDDLSGGESGQPQKGARQPLEEGDGDSTSANNPGEKPGKRPSWGEVRDAPANVEPAQLRAIWAVAAERARMVARARGNMPGQFEKLVEAAKAPLIDWKEHLWHLVEECFTRKDYSWTAPDETYMRYGLYVPTLAGEQLGPIVFIKDTSASCDEEVARQAPAEIEAINDSYEPEVLYVLDVDTRVAKVHEVYPGEKIQASAQGGGGTDYRPAFEWVDKQAIQPAMVIYMGDMGAVFPEREPDYEVIWLMTTHHEPAVKWGHRVRLPL